MSQSELFWSFICEELFFIYLIVLNLFHFFFSRIRSNSDFSGAVGSYVMRANIMEKWYHGCRHNDTRWIENNHYTVECMQCIRNNDDIPGVVESVYGTHPITWYNTEYNTEDRYA